MGIRLNSTTTEQTTDKKPESASIEAGLELSNSNPVEAPIEVVEDVATVPSSVEIVTDRAPAADEDFNDDLFAAIMDDGRDKDMQAVFDEAPDALDNAKVVARKVDVNHTQQLRNVQEQFKVSPDKAMGLLKQYPYEELRAINKLNNVTHDYPGISKWAQKPENMKLVQKDPDAFKKIEESSKMLSYLGDYGKVALQNLYMIPMMGLHAAVSTGTVSIEDAADMMAKAQDGIDANQISYNRQGMIEIGTGMDKLTNNLKKILPYKFSDAKGDVTLDSLGNIGNKLKTAVTNNDYSFLTRAYKRFKGTDTGLLDFLGSVVKNPSAALLLSGQSAYSIAPGLVAPIVGAAGGNAVAGPVGAAIGTVGASYTTGFAVSYSQFFQEESEKFKNPKTGKIDFRKMYSDPAVVTKMRNMALKYGAAHGLFEAIGGKILGKTFAGAKNATKGAKVAALAVESIEQAATEFGGEALAQATTGKSIGEAISQGTAEAVFSVPFTPGAAIIQATNMARINAKNKAKEGAPKPSVFSSPQQVTKIVNEKIEANNALQNRQIMAELREAKTPAVKDAPQQTQELIQESTSPTAAIGTEDGVVLEDRIGQVPEIYFDVNQFESLAEQVGEDPMAMAEHLGPKGVEAYIAAKKADTGTFQVTADEYHRYSDNRPELDDIMYVNDSEMNAVEAKQTLDMATELEELLLDSEDETSFDDTIDDGDEPPPIPEDSFNVWEPITADAEQGDLISRPVELIQSSRTAEQRKVAQKIRTQTIAAFKKAAMDPELAEAVAALQFSHQRFRSETTGENITSLSDTTQISFSSKINNSSYGKMTLPKGHTAPDIKVIFGPGAKASTAVHEFAHSWLHNMIIDFNAINENLTRTEAQESYYDAMRQVAKMFEVENVAEIYNKSPEEIKRIHETFARTAELYFLEGDLQNSSMRRIFETVRKWMADVASRVLGLGRQYPALKLSPEIERMFSTILDSSRQAQERSTEMFPEPLFTADMAGDKAERYKNAIADSRSEAVAKMYSGFFNESLREREAKIDAALDQIRLQAENEVNELPAIVLMDLIKARGPDAKITYQSILDHVAFGNTDIMEQIKTFIAPGVMAPNKRRGVDVRDVMEALGVNDPNDFVTMLAQMKNKEELIDARANQLMDEMFPVLKTDDEMHAEAVKAIQESGREKVLALELEILADKHLATLQQMNESAVKSPLNMKRKPMTALKEIAATRVQEGALKTFKPAAYLKEATKFNKQAASYVRQGDYLAAFDAKQREAINTFAYLESLQTAKKIEKINADVKKLMKLSPNAIGDNFDFDIYTAAKEFVREFQNGETLSEPYDIDGFDKMTGNGQTNAVTLIEAMNSDLLVKDPGNPAVQTLLNLGDLIKLMRHEAREAKKMEVAGKREDINAVVGRINGELTKNNNVLSFDGRNWAKWRSGLANVDNLFAGMMTEEEWAGSTILGQLADVRSAENDKIKFENRDNETLLNAIKKMNKNDPEAQKVTNQIRSATASFFGMDLGKPVAAPEIDHTFSNKGEILKTLAINMSEDGRAKLLAGGIKSKGKEATGPIEAVKLDAMFDRMLLDGTIKKADVEFVQTILDIFESHYDAVKKGAREVDGFDIGYIKPRSFQAFGQTFKGGYIPMKRGEDIVQTLSKVFTKIDVDDNFIPDFYPVTNTSMQKTRSANAYPVNVDLGTLRTELNSVYKVAYIRPTMHEVGKVFADPSFTKVMETRRPGAMKTIVIPWFKKTMSQQYIERVSTDKVNLEGLEIIVNKSINRARTNVFLGNFMSVMKQGIGAVPAFELLPPDKIGNAAAKSFISPFGRRDDIALMSPVMAERFQTNSQNIIRSLETFSANDTWDKKGGRIVDKLTYWPIQMAQNYIDTVVWTAALDTAQKKLKLSEKQAIDYADNLIIRTQSTNNVSGVPNLRSGTVFQRMWTTFATVPIAMGGLQLESKGRAKGKNSVEYTALMLKSYMFTAALPAMLAAVVSLPAAGLKVIGSDDDERDEAAEALALRAVPEALDSVFPVAGQNLAALFGGYEFDERFAQVGVLPLASQIIQGARGARSAVGRALPSSMGDSDSLIVQGIYDKFNVDEMTDRDYRNLAIGFTLMTGIPTGSVPFMINRTEKVAPDLDMEAVMNGVDLPR